MKGFSSKCSVERRCYRTGKYTVCRCVRAAFSLEIRDNAAKLEPDQMYKTGSDSDRATIRRCITIPDVVPTDLSVCQRRVESGFVQSKRIRDNASISEPGQMNKNGSDLDRAITIRPGIQMPDVVPIRVLPEAGQIWLSSFRADAG